MQDQLAEILAYAKGIVRHKWAILLIAWVISVVGWTYVYKMPDIFTSEARVHVDTRTMLRPLLRGIAVQADVRGLVAIMKKLMFTQQNMLKVAELAGVEGDYTSEKGRYEIIEGLKSDVTISGGRDEIFSISYESSNPLMAQKVVQAVLSIFSEQTQRATLNDAGTAQRFIEDQLREYEQRLRIAEKARENFKRVNFAMLPGQGQDQINKMQAMKSELDKLEIILAELVSRKGVLQMQLDEALDSDEEWGLTGFTEKGSKEDARIISLEEKKDELLFNYTELHPHVIAIDLRINELLARKAEKEAVVQDEPSFVAMSSPYVQTIKATINQIDAQVAALNSRAKIYKGKLKEGDEQFNARLAVETEMQNLNRDYTTIKSNYLKLIERREQASMSERVDNQASSLKFKIADPANRPLSPSAPNRAILYSSAFGVGIVMGVGIALLLVLIKPVFTTTRNLRAVTGLPVLGSVSIFLSEQQIKQQKMNLSMFFGVSILLVAGYSGMMVMG